MPTSNNKIALQYVNEFHDEDNEIEEYDETEFLCNSVDNSIVEYEDRLEMSSCNVMDSDEDELDSVVFVDSIIADDVISSNKDVEYNNIIGNDTNYDVELCIP